MPPRNEASGQAKLERKQHTAADEAKFTAKHEGEKAMLTRELDEVT
jgi:hypothetical protein